MFVKYLVIGSLFLLHIDAKCVRLRNGEVCGREGQTVGQNKNYFAFQGIPYAEPPIGQLRFEPPVAKGNWNGILNATKDGNICTQGSPPQGSEDCLFINVYVPEGTNVCPVMVFIYGGGFVTGDSRYTTYGPDYFLEKGVIIVTFNYRLGIFGFLATGDSVVPGNNGLKDQVLALQWVRKNIQYFGGNRNKITIFGESAGAASVSYHLQSPLSRGLFHGAIMQSGVSLSSWALSRHIPELVRTIALKLHINTNSSEELVNALKQVDNRTLQNTYAFVEIFYYLKYDPREGLAVGPVTEPESNKAFFTKKSHELLRKGQFYRVPCIIGFNSLEVNLLTNGPYAPLIFLYMLQYQLNSTKLVPVDLNVRKDKAEAAGIAIRKKYFGDGPIIGARDQFSKFASDDNFVRPTMEFVRQVVKFIITYLYVFSYEGDLGGANNETGVGHAEDLVYMWKSNLTFSQEDNATRDAVVSMWTNFAKNRNPGYRWIKSNNKDFPYLNIGKDIEMERYPEQSYVEFWFKLYEAYGNPPYDTY